jgi:hypothetical protein
MTVVFDSLLKKRQRNGDDLDHETLVKRQKVVEEAFSCPEVKGYNFRQNIKPKMEKNFVYQSISSSSDKSKPFIVSYGRPRASFNPSE